MSTVSFAQSGSIAVLSVDNPPVNALSHDIRSGLLRALAEALAAPSVKLIVLQAEGRTFMAGADIAEFGQPLKDPSLPEVVAAFEESGKPILAALHGTVLGGGLEVALGCHYRIALESTKLGLPEIKLGLIPGAGGTQRLPRAIGAQAALDMILSGTPIAAPDALELGLLDRVAKSDLNAAAMAYALELLAEGAAPRPLRDLEVTPIDAEILTKARAGIAKHPSGPIAPAAAIDAIDASLKMSFSDGLKREGELFMACYESAPARALWHVFFAERKAARIPDLNASVKVKPVRQVAVIGAGTMGRGIALSCLNAGLSVTLIDSDPDSLKRAIKEIENTWDSAIKRGKLEPSARDERRGRLTLSESDDALAQVDLAIEAVFESMAIKKQVFARLDALCAPGTILATNTSTLDVAQIAQATKRPEDVVGLHFFSPAHVMRLLEIVRTDSTSREVMASAFAFAKSIGKVAVQARVCFGFIGNRMIESYLEEALTLLLEGALPAQVDEALTTFGMAMGPFAMADLAGLDVGYRIRRERSLSSEQQRLFRLPDALVEQGRMGQKSGLGFYRYAPGQRVAQADPEVHLLIARIANELAVAPRVHSTEEIVERCMLRLLNEGADVLNEGIALRADDVDTVYVNGYGFPAWRGGPMYLAKTPSFAHTVSRLRALEESLGARFRPSPWLLNAANASDPLP